MAKLRQHVCLSGSMQISLFFGLAFIFYSLQYKQAYTLFMKIQIKYFLKLADILAVSHTPKVALKLNISMLLMSTNFMSIQSLYTVIERHLGRFFTVTA
jgi:hypothetical protein